MFAQEDNERALIFLGDAALGQFLVDAPDFVAVEGFPEGVVDGKPHAFVHSREGRRAYFVDFIPERDVFGVAVLELYEFRAGGVGRGGVGFCERTAALVHLL